MKEEMMNWDILRQFQDGLQEIGIAGNDLAVYAEGKPVYRYFTGWQNRESGSPLRKKRCSGCFP